MSKIIITKEYEFNLDQESFEYILNTAQLVIHYWSKDSSIELVDEDSDIITFVVVDEDNVKHVILKEHLEKVICDVVSRVSRNNIVNADIYDDIVTCIEDDDIGAIDATTADTLIQLSCFGDIIYG